MTVSEVLGTFIELGIKRSHIAGYFKKYYEILVKKIAFTLLNRGTRFWKKHPSPMKSFPKILNP